MRLFSGEFYNWDPATATGCCLVCLRTFNDSSNLRRHIRTVHSQNTQIQCQICSKWFKNENSLKQHNRLKHETLSRAWDSLGSELITDEWPVYTIDSFAND